MYKGFCPIWAGTIVVNGHIYTNEWYECIGIHLCEFPMCSLHPICDLDTRYSLFPIDPIYYTIHSILPRPVHKGVQAITSLCTQRWSPGLDGGGGEE